jgi:hypothetical protein
MCLCMYVYMDDMDVCYMRQVMYVCNDVCMYICIHGDV